MIFNRAGRLINTQFYINNEPLEPVKTFCYLGFEVVPSGIVTHAKNALNDKAKKALHTLFGAIAKFDLPGSLSIRLFHSYISPILLYGVENWSILTDLDIDRFDDQYIFKKTERSGADIVHRKLLKFVLGMSETCHSMAIYGDTCEVPLSLKGYRLMLNYWKRLTSLPERSLAKKALIENANIRSNWIKTILKTILKTIANSYEKIQTRNKVFYPRLF